MDVASSQSFGTGPDPSKFHKDASMVPLGSFSGPPGLDQTELKTKIKIHPHYLLGWRLWAGDGGGLLAEPVRGRMMAGSLTNNEGSWIMAGS